MGQGNEEGVRQDEEEAPEDGQPRRPEQRKAEVDDRAHFILDPDCLLRYSSEDRFKLGFIDHPRTADR